MTLDEIAATMRHRFTESKGAAVSLTAEEWAVLADAVYLRDALQAITESPESQDARTKVATILTKHGRR